MKYELNEIAYLIFKITFKDTKPIDFFNNISNEINGFVSQRISLDFYIFLLENYYCKNVKSFIEIISEFDNVDEILEKISLYKENDFIERLKKATYDYFLQKHNIDLNKINDYNIIKDIEKISCNDDLFKFGIKLAKEKFSNKKYFPMSAHQLMSLVSNYDIKLSDIDISQITNMNGIFSYSTRQDWSGIEDWDVSHVTDMSYLFAYSSFNGNISNWDVSNVRDMSNMFSETPFNDDISKWNTKNVTNMSAMFYNSKFNGDISNWDVSNVKDMSDMFEGSKFNKDISKWNTKNVRDMEGMFYDSVFNQDISKWDVSNVTDMSWMFAYSNFNNNISNWDVSNVKTMESMFENCKFNGDLCKWDVSKVENMESMFLNTEINFDLGAWTYNTSQKLF